MTQVLDFSGTELILRRNGYDSRRPGEAVVSCLVYAYLSIQGQSTHIACLGYIAATTHGAGYRMRKHKNTKTAQQLGQLESSARLNFLLQFACPIM